MTTSTSTTMTTVTTSTAFSLPGSSEPSSKKAASVNAPLIEESGAQRRGSESPRHDDHVPPPLHLNRFNGTQSRAEEVEQPIATGETIGALIDAILEIVYSEEEEEEYDSVTSLGMPSFGSEAAAMDDNSTVCGVEEREEEDEEEEEGGVDASARRAWEDMKRRLMDVEEFGAGLPLDGVEGSSRESRARRRKSWAEKAAVRGHVREEASRRTSAKKGRRHAGCWVREDGVFMRLVRETHLFFFFFISSFVGLTRF